MKKQIPDLRHTVLPVPEPIAAESDDPVREFVNIPAQTVSLGEYNAMKKLSVVEPIAAGETGNALVLCREAQSLVESIKNNYPSQTGFDDRISTALCDIHASIGRIIAAGIAAAETDRRAKLKK